MLMRETISYFLCGPDIYLFGIHKIVKYSQLLFYSQSSLIQRNKFYILFIFTTEFLEKQDNTLITPYIFGHSIVREAAKKVIFQIEFPPEVDDSLWTVPGRHTKQYTYDKIDEKEFNKSH